MALSSSILRAAERKSVWKGGGRDSFPIAALIAISAMLTTLTKSGAPESASRVEALSADGFASSHSKAFVSSR